MNSTIQSGLEAGLVARDDKAPAQQRPGSCAASCAYPRFSFRNIQVGCFGVLPKPRPSAVLLSTMEPDMHQQMQVLDRHKLLDGGRCRE